MTPQSEEEIAKIKNPVKIRIEREDNVWGGAIPFVIYDGKKEIGRLGPAGYFEWKREAGYLKLTISETTGAVGKVVGQGHPNDIIYEDYLQPGDSSSYLCGLTVDDDVTAWIKPQQEQASEDILAFCRAEKSHTIDSYGEFIKSHAKSTRVEEAIRRYEGLIEEAGLLNIDTLNDDTMKTLHAYLAILPHGKYAQFVGDVNQYYEAEKSPSTEVFADYLRKWPHGRFEKRAKDNVAFSSLGTVSDPLLVNALEKTRQSLLSTFKTMSKEMEEDIRQRKRKTPSLWYVKTDLVKPCKRLVVEGVIFDGEFRGHIERSSRINHEWYDYTGDVSVDQFKYFLKGGVAPGSPSDITNPNLYKGSWVTLEDDTYIFDGFHWIHGLTNPFFPVNGFIYEK